MFNSINHPLLYGHQNNPDNNDKGLDASKKDFSTIQRLIKMPPLRKLTPEQSPFGQPQNELIKSNFISQQLKRSAIQLRQNLRNQFYTYQDVGIFQFYFPDSKFPPVAKGQRSNISYEQKNIVEQQNTFRDRLSQEQIQQIRQTGQFKVKSTKQWVKLPYVWKMNDTLFKGIKNVKNNWVQRLGCAHSFVYDAWVKFADSLPKQLLRIVKWPWRLFSLFFGKKTMDITLPIDYDHQLAKDFWNQVMDKYYIQSKQWGSALWIYLDAAYRAEDRLSIERISDPKQYKKLIELQQKSLQQYNKRLQQREKKMNQINAVVLQFDKQWVKMRKKVFTQVSATFQKNNHHQLQFQPNNLEQKKKQKENQLQILQKFNDQKFRYYTKFLTKSLPKQNIPTNVIQAILTVLTLVQISTRKQRKLTNLLNNSRSKAESQVRQQHPIRSLHSSWYENKVKEVYAPAERQINQQFKKSFMDENLSKMLNNKQLQTYKLWLEYCSSYERLVQQKKYIKQPMHGPRRIFRSTYALIPPYTVFKHQNDQISVQTAYYELIRQREMKVATANHCWKFYLYCMRVKCWTINCLVVLFYSCWQGMFGLRCLCGSDEFTYDQHINSSSGQIVDQQRKTVLGHFISVLNGISKSRNQFQALPDTGIFGKNCSRIYNLLECYIFRFLIVGVFIVLILYPVAIILLSLLCFLLIITVWAWIPLILLLTYLFNIFVYQFQSSSIPYECSARLFPFFSLILSLIISIIKALFYIVLFLIISPLVWIIVFVFTFLCRCLRSLADCIMLCLISYLGRTPSRDTAIARKISGPGMSKQYYMSINEEDLYILIQSQLEQLFLEQLGRLTNEKLNMPVDNFNKTMKLIIDPLIFKSNQLNDSSQNINYSPVISGSVPQANPGQIRNIVTSYKQQYNEDYQQFISRYPNKPYNTRFTQEQINFYFQNTQNIVKSFVNKSLSHKWIFQHFQISQDDYQELTRKIWIRIFQCGEQIFQPLESIDQRFKLEDQYKQEEDDYQATTGLQSFSHQKMKGNVHKVMEALEGQVQLKPRTAKFGSFRHNIMEEEIDFYNTVRILSDFRQNSEGNVFFSKDNATFLFYPNPAIKQLTRVQEAQYVNKRQQNERNYEWW